jgi:flagellar motility protein MotE (MotC chaperone)
MRSKFYFLLGSAIFLMAAASVVAESPKRTEDLQQALGQAASASRGGTPVALTMEAIQELEERKRSLDARERQLNERAKALEIQEKVLKEKLQRMEDLNKKMAERLENFKRDHEERVMKLVAVVETMRPQAAAEYVENLDPELAVEILARIQVPRAARILNPVDRKRSARLTELYAGYRDRVEVESPPAAEGKEEQPISEKM